MDSNDCEEWKQKQSLEMPPEMTLPAEERKDSLLGNICRWKVISHITYITDSVSSTFLEILIW